MKAALHLEKSLAEISTIVEVEAVEAKKALEDEFREKLPGALKKIIDQIKTTGVNAFDFNGLTVKEMHAICVIVFMKPKPAGKKDLVVKQVSAYHHDHPKALEDAMKANGVLPTMNGAVPTPAMAAQPTTSETGSVVVGDI